MAALAAVAGSMAFGGPAQAVGLGAPVAVGTGGSTCVLNASSATASGQPATVRGGGTYNCSGHIGEGTLEVCMDVGITTGSYQGCVSRSFYGPGSMGLVTNPIPCTFAQMYITSTRVIVEIDGVEREAFKQAIPSVFTCGANT